MLAFLALVGGGCEGGKQGLDSDWQGCGGGVAQGKSPGFNREVVGENPTTALAGNRQPQPCPYLTATPREQREATSLPSVSNRVSGAFGMDGPTGLQGLGGALPGLPPAPHGSLASAAQVAATIPSFDPGGWAYAARSGPLSELELRALLAEAGWSEALIPEALAVIHCESRGDPAAVSPTEDYGLLQLNALTWTAFFGFESPTAFLEPLVNLRAALVIYERGGGWGPWVCQP